MTSHDDHDARDSSDSHREKARQEEHTIKQTFAEKGDERRQVGSESESEFRRRRKKSHKGGHISGGGEAPSRQTPHVTTPHA